MESRSSRKLLYWGYYGWYDTDNNHWIYWGIPIIIVGVLGFAACVAYYIVRKRRLARTQLPVVSPPQHQNAPVTGYPDYTSQYNNDYNNYSSYPPPQGQPNHGGTLGSKQEVQMGVPAPGGYPQRY